MYQEVTINMDNKSSLVTIAMLTSFLSEEKKDYFDLITPFVLQLLPKKVGDIIDVSGIVSKLESEYGFEEFPINVLKTILDRCAKGKEAYLFRSKSNYYLKKIYDSMEFESNKDIINDSLEEVMFKLKDYFENSTFKKGITTEDVKSIFMNFMEYYGYSVIVRFDELRKLTNIERNNYHVARFIIDEYEKESKIYRSIIEIVKGFFVYKSIYFFSTEQIENIDIKLNDTDVYLDTRIVINALGLHIEEDYLGTKELLKLIIDNGGHLKVFPHTVDEIAGILTKYARDPLARATMNLDFFDRNLYDEDDVLRIRGALEIKLSNIEIEITDTPNQNISSEDRLAEMGFLDVVELKSHLIKSFEEWGRTFKDENLDRLDRDVSSIASISLLRGEERSVGIENCKAIFATHNYGITRAVNDLYKTRFCKGEISFIINEIDLTALLWLMTFDKQSDLPSLKLLENAYSAIRPSNQIIDIFADKVIKLEKEGILTEQEALLMRTEPVIRGDVAKISQNDPSSINSTMILEIKDNYVKSLVLEKDQDIMALKKELDKERSKKNKGINEAEKVAKDESNKYFNRINKFKKFIIFIFFFVGIIILIANNLKSNIIISGTLILASILGFIDSIRTRNSLIDKYINKLKQRKFDEIYKVEIEKIECYFADN